MVAPTVAPDVVHPGDRFGMLTVISRLNRPGSVYCRCECGRRVMVAARQLAAGRRTGCGTCTRITRSTAGRMPAVASVRITFATVTLACGHTARFSYCPPVIGDLILCLRCEACQEVVSA